MEDFVEELLPLARRQTVKRVAGGVGKGAAESEYLLKLGARVQTNLLASGLGRHPTPRGLWSGGKTFVAGRHPGRNLRTDIRTIVGRLARRGCGPDQLAGSN